MVPSNMHSLGQRTRRPNCKANSHVPLPLTRWPWPCCDPHRNRLGAKLSGLSSSRLVGFHRVRRSSRSSSRARWEDAGSTGCLFVIFCCFVSPISFSNGPTLDTAFGTEPRSNTVVPWCFRYRFVTSRLACFLPCLTVMHPAAQESNEHLGLIVQARNLVGKTFLLRPPEVLLSV